MIILSGLDYKMLVILGVELNAILIKKEEVVSYSLGAVYWYGY
jgi:hypothetical protein